MFQRYRKTTPTLARVLTEVDYAASGGMMATNEGVKPFLPGDYVGEDVLGHWPIPIEKVRTRYERVGPADGEGYIELVSLEVRQAMQMSERFMVNGLKGKAGDYLVCSADSAWVVDREQFERTYALCENEQAKGAN